MPPLDGFSLREQFRVGWSQSVKFFCAAALFCFSSVLIAAESPTEQGDIGSAVPFNYALPTVSVSRSKITRARLRGAGLYHSSRKDDRGAERLRQCLALMLKGNEQ